MKISKTGSVVFIVFFLCLGKSPLLYAATSAEIQQWLLAHNTYRALHGVPRVVWSSALASKAQAWADTCPSGHSTYGENILFANYSMSAGRVVARWYREESVYDYTNPGFSLATGHFTQVVWKNTAEIGCGYKTGCGGKWPYIWICQYSPPGNIEGLFAANVLPILSEIGGNRNFLPALFKLLLFE